MMAVRLQYRDVRVHRLPVWMRSVVYSIVPLLALHRRLPSPIGGASCVLSTTTCRFKCMYSTSLVKG